MIAFDMHEQKDTHTYTIHRKQVVLRRIMEWQRILEWQMGTGALPCFTLPSVFMSFRDHNKRYDTVWVVSVVL